MALTKISRSLLDTGVSDSSDATAITIDSSENVGIGVTTPFSQTQITETGWSSGAPYGTVLTVTGNNTNDANWGHLLITDSSTGTGNGGMLRFAVGSTSSDISPHSGIDGFTEGSNYGGLKFLTRPNGGTATERMRIDSSGNVGIGTTSPSATLDVAGSSNSTYLIVGGDDATNLRGLKFTSSASASFNGAVHTINAPSVQGVIALATHNTERMRIRGTNGDILLCKTVDTFSTAGIRIQHSTGRSLHTVSGDNVMDLNRTTSNGVILGFYLNGSSVGTISTNSNNLPSDKNFKRNISDLNLGLNLVTKLKPSQYNYKIDSEDCPKMYGLIAQDLEESLTEVGIEKNSTWLLQHEPKDDEKQSDYSLDYTKLIPILINSIQEQQEQIEALQSEINTLKGGE